jgi:hypothetical protein
MITVHRNVKGWNEPDRTLLYRLTDEEKIRYNGLK